ncbi:MAG: metallophosphoesterase [Firmicutes bacterium]|nr:metallophosphoesterase [Bacillota bacterium]
MKSDFKPVLRFIVSSDLHIEGPDCPKLDRLKDMFRYCRNYAAESDYQNLDAYFFVGDSTNNGTKEQYDAFWQTVLCGSAQDSSYAVIAKNHDNWEFGRECVKTGLAYYKNLTGKDTDFHIIRNGFHFIGISTCDETGVYYTEKQAQWLDDNIREAIRQTPDRPVFVFQHEHVKGTVYGSSEFDGWGMDFFSEILRKYPQIVHFSGHSHYPLNDPRSVVQKDFTTVGTGAMSYAEFTVDGERTVHPDGFEQIAQGWVVEADEEGDLLLIGMDFTSGEELCRIELPAPVDRKRLSRTYESIESMSRPPVFPEGAQASVETSESVNTVSFPAAIGGLLDPVFLYRVYLMDRRGQILEQKTVQHHYWYKNDICRYSASLPFHGDQNSVTVEAENAFGKKSRKLFVEVGL